MNRTEVINLLLSKNKGNRYLEIGVYDEENNFNHIRCEHKVGVDLLPVTTFQGSSDDFFRQNREKFDLIFIDGIHLEEQTLRDIGNSRRSLTDIGVIVLHDCMPPDEWHQRGPEHFKDGENWNGTVWKAALKVFNYTKYKCTLLDTDWGCGIIDTAERQIPLRKDLPDQLDYHTHYRELLDYRIDVPEFLKERVKVFYHLACMGNWPEVFAEQLTQLKRNGFNEISLTMLGNEDDVQSMRRMEEESQVRCDLIYHSANLHEFERPAMLAIEKYSATHAGYVLYLHSKGVSSPGDGNKAKWRRLMMRELIDGWRNCLGQITQYDAVGVNWRTMPPTSHFCGNFWYASTSFIRTLAEFDTYYHHPRHEIWSSEYNKRLGCEFWIGSAAQEPKVLSLNCRDVDFCNNQYWVGR